MPKPKDVPEDLHYTDMDYIPERWNSIDQPSITLTPENINRIWRKQNEIIAFLKDKFGEVEDAKG